MRIPLAVDSGTLGHLTNCCQECKGREAERFMRRSGSCTCNKNSMIIRLAPSIMLLNCEEKLIKC